jgi:uncharacterized Zn-binding protein involved in type VI secretion
LSGMKIGQMFTSKKGPIITGSPNTFIGSDSKKAARAVVDKVLCADHKLMLIATGSLDVYINMQPAARKTDKTVCDGKIAEGYADVFFGGPTGQYLDIESEVPGWLVKTLEIAGILAMIVGTGGAILTVGIGAALGGLAAGYVGGLVGTEIGGRIGEHFFGEKGKVIGEVIGEFVGSNWAGPKGEKIGAALEGRLPSSVLARLPGETATNTLKTRMSTPENFAPGERPAFWTGPGSRDAAVANGHSTMENTVGGQSTEAFVNGQKLPWEQSKPIWTESSTTYANQVGQRYGTMDPNTGLPISGPNAGQPVTVYVSESANPNSIYFTTEKPLLQSYGVNIVEVVVPAPKP